MKCFDNWSVVHHRSTLPAKVTMTKSTYSFAASDENFSSLWYIISAAD